jgi:hypothetical protein
MFGSPIGRSLREQRPVESGNWPLAILNLRPVQSMFNKSLDNPIRSHKIL